MPRVNHATLLPAVALLALGACAAPKAEVVGTPEPAKVEPMAAATPEPVEEPPVTEPALPPLPDDGFRMPDLLALPQDADFRRTTAPEGGSGAIYSRPPTDPPSRVKPPAEGR